MSNKEIINAWILIRSYIDRDHRKVSLNISIFNAVNVLDEKFGTVKNNSGRKVEHVCDLREFDSQYDTCNACKQNKRKYK